MKTTLSIHLLAAALLLPGRPFSASGAEIAAKRLASPADPRQEALAANVKLDPDGRYLFNLDIIGGQFEPKPGVKKPATVGNLSEFVRANMPNANIVLSPGTAEITVEELRLRSAEIQDFLQALIVATDNRVNWRALGGGGQAYSLMSRPAPEPRVEVFNLSSYIARASALQTKDQPAKESSLERVLSSVYRMIHETVEFANLTGPDRAIDLRFHADARLLVVRGTPKAIDVARKVVTALNEPASKERAVRPDLLDIESTP